MLRLLMTAALVMTALFATANMALSREWEVAGEMDSEWQLVIGDYTDPARGLAGTVMNLDGSNSHTLSFNGRQIANPSCSPNGSHLVFHIRTDGLLVMNVATERELWRWNERSLASPWAGGLGVSDDGQKAIFEGSIFNEVDIINGIWVLDAISSQDFTPGVDPRNGHSAVWFDVSPDGNQIAFQSWDSVISRANTDGSDVSQLVIGARSPDWSPDGTMIAFAADWDGAFNIYIMDLTRRLWAQVTHLKSSELYGVGNTQPSWSPDGNQIVYIFDPVVGGLQDVVNLVDIGSSREQVVFKLPLSSFSSACILQNRPTSLIAGS
jgi:Tol biopolymer transport system component